MSGTQYAGPTVPQLQADLNRQRQRALEEVLPAADEITLLGRYRVAKLNDVNSGLVFKAAMKVTGAFPSDGFELWKRVLRHDPVLAVAAPDEFAERIRQLQTNRKAAAEEVGRLLPVFQARLVDRYPNHVQMVPDPVWWNPFREQTIVNPDTIPKVQREVAKAAGIRVPDTIPQSDLFGYETAVELSFAEALEDVFAAQRRLVARAEGLIDDSDLLGQLQEEVERRNPVWTLPPPVYADMCGREGSHGDARDLHVGVRLDPNFGFA
jgi:hypothetical protein